MDIIHDISDIETGHLYCYVIDDVIALFIRNAPDIEDITIVYLTRGGSYDSIISGRVLPISHIKEADAKVYHILNPSSFKRITDHVRKLVM